MTFTLNCKDFWGTRSPEALSERQPASKVRRFNAAGFAERMRIDQDFLTRRSSRPDQVSMEQEIDLLLERMEDGAKSPLNFWKSNQFDFPWLRPIAKHYLAIPCSSAEAERTFSASGRLISKSRANLSKETVRSMLHLQINVLREEFGPASRADE